MWSFWRRLLMLWIISGAIITAGPAKAYEALDPASTKQRAELLLGAPENNFYFEAKRLTTIVSDKLVPVEGPDFDVTPFRPKDEVGREKFLHKKLTEDQFKELEKTRMAPDSAAAVLIGKDLPPALREYTAGAVAYVQENFPDAASHFQAALEDNVSNPAYKVWANYMLGRAYMKLGDQDKAQPCFTAARDLVIAGAEDPMGLGVASLGEEARIYLNRAGGVLGEKDFQPDRPDRFQNLSRALKLYAEQAAAGCENGRDSLHILAKELVNQPSDFPLIQNDELARRLLVIYARTYSGPRGGVDNPEQYTTPVLSYFPSEDKDFAGPLASLAYDNGKPDLALSYAEQSPGAFSTWVKAKLALAKRNFEVAAHLYDQAHNQTLNEVDHSSIDPNEATFEGERATLALARGQFLDALKGFYPIDYVWDTNYLAERVLTVDELKSFVDNQLPQSINEKRAPLGNEEQEKARTQAISLSADELRSVLARRLMRVGRSHEALPYYTRTNVPAQEYVHWLDMEKSSSSLKKAEAFYRAAALERHFGEDLLGRSSPSNTENDTMENGGDTKDAAFITQDERDRLKASLAEAPVIDSFRTLAATHAGEAANYLPQKSQAFAAVLCRASNWTHPESDQGRTFYARYVKEGAIVHWATHFGHRCPEPDFTQTRYFGIKHVLHNIHKKIDEHKITIGAGILGVLLAGFLIRRRAGRTVL